MAVTIRNKTTANSGGTSTSSFVLSAPTGVSAGDVMICTLSISSNSSPTLTPPSGWTLIQRQIQSTTLTQAVFWKLATASEPGSYTWTYSTSAPYSGVLVAYTDINGSSPIADHSALTGSGSSSVTFLSTGAESGTVYAILCGASRSTTSSLTVSSASSGWTTDGDAVNTVNPFTEAYIEDQHSIYISPGSVAPGSTTISASVSFCTMIVVLNVAATSGFFAFM